MWSRQLTLTVGMQEEQFTRAFIKAMKSEEVCEIIRSIISSEMKEELKELREEVKALKDAVKSKDDQINDLKKRLSSAEVRLDAQEQYSRRNSLRVYGLPEQEHEDTVQVATDLIKSKLKVDIQPADIDRIHRIGRRNRTETSRPVIIKFATYGARSKVFRAKSKLKESGSRNIYSSTRILPKPGLNFSIGCVK